MTPLLLVAKWRRWLLLTASGAAAAAGVASGLVSFVIARLLDASPPQARVLAVVVGVLAAVWDLARRLKGPLSADRVALWLEERSPSLQYALVSALGLSSVPPRLAQAIERVDVARPARRAVIRTLVPPLAALALAVILATLQRSDAGAALLAPVAERVRTGESNALANVRVTVFPPAYARRPVVRLVSPDVIRALTGSRITVEGRAPDAGDSAAVAVSLDSSALMLSSGEGQWRAALAVPRAPAVLTLRHGVHARLIAIEPVADSLPAVALTSPSRDTVLRVPEGQFALRARAEDDHGLTSSAFEYIVSSGQGEIFTFSSGTLGAQRPAGNRVAELSATLDLAALALKPGDVVHLRAVARDANAVSGPGIGASDTRTFRVARAGEYDSIAVEAAPPPEEDKTLLSQRMLINLTETLVRRSPRLSRDAIVSESRRIARDQARLRKEVSDLVFSRLGDDVSGEHFHGDGHQHTPDQQVQGPLTPAQLLAAAERATEIHTEATDFAEDETPVVAINRPLLEAYNAMWDAGRELEGGAPRRALPPMYAALAAIQKARAAERLYLRGVPPRVVVDLQRVRLQGTERGSDAVRVSRPPVDAARREALERLHRSLGVSSGSAAADSLLLIRLSLVGEWPAAAATFDALIADVRAGRDATASVLAVRRALDGATAVRDSLSVWSLVP
jgi:hypothetical protein